ncbi:MAG: ABC transporter ATP-binding protein [Clostridiales bacterium]|nr:ABC transporter ATP-binding protein [Clostridiales bacterium]
MIQCENMVKIYKTRETEVIALQGLDLTVEDGELMAIIGNSGSGKSTLLNMIGGLDRPSAGSLYVDGKNLLKFKEIDYVRYKRETVGFIWQNNARNLIPYLTALDNIQLPMVLAGRRKRRQRAMELLEQVGLAHRARSRLAQLSGGEQQRVGIAIALANNPRLLLADEPTGAVDSRTADQIMDIFRSINRQTGLTVVIVTHDINLSRKVDRIVAIRDGRTSSEFIRRRSYRDELRSVSSYEEEELSHVELSIVDGTGRVQLPRKYLEAMGVCGKSKMLVELEDGKITLRCPSGEEELETLQGSRIIS